MRISKRIALYLLLIPFTVGVAFAETVWLDTLDISTAYQGWGEPHKNQAAGGHTLAIGSKQFDRGFGTHAESVLYGKLDGRALNFSADADDKVKPARQCVAGPEERRFAGQLDEDHLGDVLGKTGGFLAVFGGIRFGESGACRR